jgi:D-tyrosyl-tRNA(Tyr) deacylase
MRALIQRVQRASVVVDENTVGAIGSGLLVLLGIEDADDQEDIIWLSQKVAKLRVFDDENGIMNRSVMDIDGGLLVVSQFTLHASTKKGNRPSYIKAAKPPVAIPLYEQFVKQLGMIAQRPVETGEFGAMMQVELINDGPVTIWIDSKNRE